MWQGIEKELFILEKKQQKQQKQKKESEGHEGRKQVAATTGNIVKSAFDRCKFGQV